jgi:hypothetical protein
MDRPSTLQRTRRRGLVAALALAGSLLAVPLAGAGATEPTDMVLDWNANAAAVLGAGTAAVPPGLGQGPPTSAIHLAMVHGAIYDAVNAIDGTHEPYLSGLPAAAAGASRAAAVATAAHDVLVGLTPATLPLVKDRIDAMYATSLGEIDAGQAKTDGIAIGAATAAAMLAERTGDGRFGTHTWTAGTGVGEWRLVPPGNANVFAWAALVDPFTLESQGQFRTAGPLKINSGQYAKEFNEVKEKGAQTGSTRTAAEDLLASFVSANPLPFMNQGLREVAAGQGLSTSAQARFFAMTSMASADALIGCWDDKDYWSFWRPLTAIREAASDGNPNTDADPGWLALYGTPGYPEHPSGYNCYTAAMMHTARLFYGTDRMDFSLTSPGTAPLPGSTRVYTRFTDVIDDTIYGRILTGFHFRTADVQGAWIGKKVAQWVDAHYFEPVD